MKKNNKIISLSLTVVLVFILVAGFFEYVNEISGIYENLRESVSYTSSLEMNINRAVRGEPGPSENEEEKGGAYDNLLFILSSIFIFNGTLSALMLTASIPLLIRKKINSDIKRQKFRLLGWLKNYKVKCMKFLSPVEKSIFNRAGEYDINPVLNILWGNNPCFALSGTRVFFMEKNSRTAGTAVHIKRRGE